MYASEVVIRDAKKDSLCRAAVSAIKKESTSTSEVNGRVVDAETGSPLAVDIVLGDESSDAMLQDTTSSKDGYFRLGTSYDVSHLGFIKSTP